MKNEQGKRTHLSKKHPREFRELKEKEEFKILKEETKMDEEVKLRDLITEAEKKTSERRGLLAPPLSKEEIRMQQIASVHLRMLEQWRLMLLSAKDNTVQKIIDSVTQKVKLDEDIQQALALEACCAAIQPVIQTYGLIGAASELVYKEFEELGVKIERPSMPTLNAILIEIKKRVAVGTTEKRKKVKGEE